MYPVMLCLEKRPCLIVGGGEVALRKTEGLLAEGARVTVVAREACPEVRELADQERIRLELRPYRPGEVSGFGLVIAATDDRAVNRAVFEDAGRFGIWVNVADDPELCSFTLPARIRRGAFQIAIASEGTAPFAMRRLRALLEAKFGPEWGGWIGAAARFRRAVHGKGLDTKRQDALFDRFFRETVDPERLAVRVPGDSEIDAWLSGI